MDTATDCPIRERAGWTGDINIFAPTATTFVDAQAFLRRYLHDVALEQRPDGTVPPFIPSQVSHPPRGHGAWLERLVSTSVGWGDVTVMLPWTLYQAYGDRAILEQQFGSMQRWVDHLERAARGVEAGAEDPRKVMAEVHPLPPAGGAFGSGEAPTGQ